MTAFRNLAQGVSAFTSNAVLVTGDRTVLVDTGANFDVVAGVREHADGLDAVVLTHTHPDHVGNLEALRAAFDVETWGFDASHAAVDRAVADGDLVRIGGDDYRALHTPGHKNDHLCFHAPEAVNDPDGNASGVLFAGDLVFAGGSFGRTDLAEGDRERLLASIEYVLETVTPDLGAMYTGHGPSVTDAPYEHVERALTAAKRL